MHKALLLLGCLMLFNNVSHAQLKGRWIKSKITYRNGAEIENSHPLKYNYLRYTFTKPGKGQSTTIFNSKGVLFNYSIKGNLLELKTAEGFSLNQFMIEKNDENELILLQLGSTGFESEDCLRFYFISNTQYLQGYKPAPEDILSIRGNDTVFIANQKVYPEYKGEKDYFDVLKQGMPDQGSVNLNFLATYIVRKDGVADSLKIIESISDDFDKRIIKNFNKTRNNWQPAMHNGKPVDVQMKQEYRYFSSETMLPVVDHRRKGMDAMRNGDYSTALHHFNLGLEKIPDDVEMLYQRALVKHELGNNEGGCNDLKTIKLLRNTMADVLLSKWCN